MSTCDRDERHLTKHKVPKTRSHGGPAPSPNASLSSQGFPFLQQRRTQPGCRHSTGTGHCAACGYRHSHDPSTYSLSGPAISQESSSVFCANNIVFVGWAQTSQQDKSTRREQVHSPWHEPRVPGLQSSPPPPAPASPAQWAASIGPCFSGDCQRHMVPVPPNMQGYTTPQGQHAGPPNAARGAVFVLSL